MNGAKQSPWIKQLMCNYHSLPAIPFLPRAKRQGTKGRKSLGHLDWIGVDCSSQRESRQNAHWRCGRRRFLARACRQTILLGHIQGNTSSSSSSSYQSPRGRSWTEEAITILGVLSSWKPNHVIWPDRWGGICTQRNGNGCFLNIEASLMDILYIWFFSHKGLKGSHYFSQCPTRCAHR